MKVYLGKVDEFFVDGMMLFVVVLMCGLIDLVLVKVGLFWCCVWEFLWCVVVGLLVVRVVGFCFVVGGVVVNNFELKCMFIV